MNTLFVDNIPEQFSATRVFHNGTSLQTKMMQHTKNETKKFQDFRTLLTTLAKPTVLTQPSTALNEQLEKGDSEQVSLILEHYARNISMCNRIGAANTVLVHPDSKLNLDGVSLDIVKTDALQDNEAVIMFIDNDNENGIVNGPFMAQNNNDGSITAFILENTKETMGNAEDYLRFVQFA